MTASTSATGAPRVSIVMACRDVERYVDAALHSARAQSIGDIEIIVADDGSTDGTLVRVEAHRTLDERVRQVRGEGRGPAAARNAALKVARGEWIAVLDSDDVMHPRRLEFLLQIAGETGADIVADNLLAFQNERSVGAPYLLVDAEGWREPQWIDFERFMRCNALFGAGPSLGYLKPLIRASVLNGRGYDETLRIGEDCFLLAGLLAEGARFRYQPQPWYFYRRHAASISFRMRLADIAALRAAVEPLAARTGASPALKDYAASVDEAHAFTLAVDALKRRKPMEMARALSGRPRACLWLARAMARAVGNRLPRRAPAGAAELPAIHLGGTQTVPPAVAAACGEAGVNVQQLMWSADDAQAVFPKPGDAAFPAARRLLNFASRAPAALCLLSTDEAREGLPYALQPDVPRIADGAAAPLPKSGAGSADRTSRIAAALAGTG